MPSLINYRNTIVLVFLLLPVNLLLAQVLNLDSLNKAYHQLKDDSTKVRLLRELGGKIKDSDSVQGKNIYLEAVAISQRINDKEQEAKCLISLAIWNRDRNHYVTADSILRIAYRVALKGKSKAQMAAALVVIGNVFYSVGVYDSSLSYYFASVKLTEELKDYKRTAAGYGNISSLYYVLDDIPKAKIYVEKANDNLKLTSDERGLGRNFNVMAHIYAELLEYDKAIDFNLKAIRLLKKTNDEIFLQVAYENIATVYYDTKKFVIADLYCDSSLVLARKLGNVNGYASTGGEVAPADDTATFPVA